MLHYINSAPKGQGVEKMKSLTQKMLRHIIKTDTCEISLKDWGLIYEEG
jgi:hypothetical protein